MVILPDGTLDANGDRRWRCCGANDDDVKYLNRLVQEAAQYVAPDGV